MENRGVVLSLGYPNLCLAIYSVCFVWGSSVGGQWQCAVGAAGLLVGRNRGSKDGTNRPDDRGELEGSTNDVGGISIQLEMTFRTPSLLASRTSSGVGVQG